LERRSWYAGVVDVLRWLSPILLRRLGKTEIRSGILALDWSQWRPKNGMTASRKREVSSRISTGKLESMRYNHLVESMLRRILFYWHRSCLSS
jgi:hypothetical protein